MEDAISFDDFKISKQLKSSIDELGFTKPTPIQAESFSVIMSGRNVVGVSQTGTGKTLAFLLPILQSLKYTENIPPTALIIVPTRELVLQVVKNVEDYAKYKTVRVLGVYGGANIKKQKEAVAKGVDILVATPGRLYDIVMHGALTLKHVKKLVIDEVDVMLDLGFRFQINNIFELLPSKRQNIMFSATMTDEVSTLINDFFIEPYKISIAVSGTPLENIAQSSYAVPNFYTKANLVMKLVEDKETFSKVLVFVSSKKNADRLFTAMEEKYAGELGIIHSNKSQNFRIRNVEEFDSGAIRILIATDIMARGLDLDRITHVVNVDTPNFPENYMHRIGRTGRAEQEGNSILLYTEKEVEAKEEIEELMDYEIPQLTLPEDLEFSQQLLPEERKQVGGESNYNRNDSKKLSGAAFHEKSEKNSKVNLGGKWRRFGSKKYKKPQKRGDKIQNMASKRRKKKKQ